MIRERDNWTCFTHGTGVDPRRREERNITMAFYVHAGRYQPQGIYKLVKPALFNISFNT
jgi:hypothetical protein